MWSPARVRLVKRLIGDGRLHKRTVVHREAGTGNFEARDYAREVQQFLRDARLDPEAFLAELARINRTVARRLTPAARRLPVARAGRAGRRPARVLTPAVLLPVPQTAAVRGLCCGPSVPGDRIRPRTGGSLPGTSSMSSRSTGRPRPGVPGRWRPRPRGSPPRTRRCRLHRHGDPVPAVLEAARGLHHDPVAQAERAHGVLEGIVDLPGPLLPAGALGVAGGRVLRHTSTCRSGLGMASIVFRTASRRARPGGGRGHGLSSQRCSSTCTCTPS